MIEKRKGFCIPPDNTTIWRYMSFTKFVDLIATKKLYFHRLDQNEDSWEGFLPENYDIKDKLYIRYNRYINCWSINNYESAAMWKVYGPPGESVAIKTNVGKLKESLKGFGIPIHMGKVKYEKENIPHLDFYLPVLYKIKPYYDEHELRLCLSSAETPNPQDFTPLIEALKTFGCDMKSEDILKNCSDDEHSKKANPKGICARVDLNSLIDKVIMCPDKKSYLKDSLIHTLKHVMENNKIDLIINDSGLRKRNSN